jgi:hypothetical protein
MTDSTLRDDLAAAFDAQEAPAAVEAPEPTQDASPAPEAPEAVSEPQEGAQDLQEAKDARARDDKGRFAKKDGIDPDAKIAPEQAKPPEAPPEVKATQPIPTPEVKAPAPEIRAPQSWKPAIREKFATLPPEVQQEVIRRERETAVALQETAEARQFHQRFQQSVAPYDPIFRSLGMAPEQAIGMSLQTLGQLASGPPAIKARVVADIVKTYGIDIQMLDSELAGQPVAPGPQAAIDPSQIVRQAREAMRAELQQAQHAQFERKVAAEIEQMKELEFFDDVREDMATIIEVSAKRGVVITPRDAYNRAVWANPHVAEVMQQRQAAKVAANPQGSTQRARAAASSVRGSPVGPTNGAQPKDLRGEIEAAWEQLQVTR